MITGARASALRNAMHYNKKARITEIMIAKST